MKKILIATVAVMSAGTLAYAAAQQTVYMPHQAAGASRVAFQEVSNASCSEDREVLACVVQLGPSPNDRWAYFLEDANGQRSDAVRLESRAPGMACAAMAYPRGNVVISGGSGDWFNGRIQTACRQ